MDKHDLSFSDVIRRSRQTSWEKIVHEAVEIYSALEVREALAELVLLDAAISVL